MSDLVKNILFWVIAAVILFVVIDAIQEKQLDDSKIAFSEFVERIEAKQVDNVLIDPNTGTVSGKDSGSNRSVNAEIPPGGHEKLNEILLENKVQYSGKKRETGGFGTFLLSFGPILLLIAVWIYFMRQMQGGGKGGGALSFGKSKARMLSEDQVKTTFADVAGVEEAKEEVGELVDFLRDPRKFQRLGGKIPRGVLMVGPPGTGKTLLARAIAGEAKVPFFTISGSDFVEMFVGVGASRVRDMFEQAKKHAPCIIFIDEIDAVGRHRGAGLGGGHDEREQTLNQLLVEMDGFEGGEGVIVIAATNRPDVLDPALLRPGRFDRQVIVGLPDIKGREQIIKVHMRKIPVGDDVEPSLIARGTPGFSGADLANLVNEAALFAARDNRRTVGMEQFEKAKDKILMGAERRSMVMTEEEKLNTAYHEAGHAIVGLRVPSHDPVYKVSIIPRGRALGVTMYLPEQDRYSLSKEALESQLSSLFGGRIAEEILNGPDQVTTGASNDIERATDIARNMVTKWGLSEKLGPLSYAEDEGEVFLGRSVTQHKNISDDTARIIDAEIREFIDRNYDRAKKILNEEIDKLHAMAQALMKYETIDAKQIEDIMKGEEPRPPADWSDKSTQSRQDNTREEESKEQTSAHEPDDNHTEDDRS
ncbi:ATP-dependent zinc metalloprotease FtsH [Kangiella spongicola]|uniref:ATP-dependent zinc metalloprotease FtsH n=1 Tax=Kangiella spongicola TaxID=796379 RepID=A0A318D445_9GAMM|nr:ATP-dependent zinc metalloprotease FtsH [Kangiella spongicola]PXF64082.1 ATP-dependent metalloprotease [Kangiella spongicola]